MLLCGGVWWSLSLYLYPCIHAHARHPGPDGMLPSQLIPVSKEAYDSVKRGHINHIQVSERKQRQTCFVRSTRASSQVPHLHTCIHTYIHTYIHACMHTYMHAYIHAYIHTYTYTSCARREPRPRRPRLPSSPFRQTQEPPAPEEFCF